MDLGDQQVYRGFIGWTLSPSSIGEIQAARARLDQAKIRAERVREIVKAEVIRAHEEVFTTQEQVEAAHRGVQAAEASLEVEPGPYSSYTTGPSTATHNFSEARLRVL